MHIRHADLKPQNIFLADNNISGLYAGYPQIKVGDFGHATIISHDQTKVLAPSEYRGGTPKCQAPEQVDATQPCTEKTNVWGIGVCVWGLMNSRGNANAFYTPIGDPVVWTPTNPRNPNVTFSQDHVRIYSDALIQLVLDCLNVDPAARPPYALMLNRIRSNTITTANVDLANGLRSAGKDDVRFHDEYGLRLSAENFPMYAALAAYWDDAPAPDKTIVAPGPDVPGVLGPGTGSTIPG